ncbi:MAG: thiamine pyrophosphate-dependent dehydrogenase E1 component subunit alpha [Actinomycetota bacterium]
MSDIFRDAIYFLGDDAAREDRDLPEDITSEDLVQLFRWMVILRTFDERAVALQRQGRLGNYPSCWGEEATQAGALYACEPDDWVFPSYRQQGMPILRGVPPATILKYRAGYGGKTGFWDPRAHRVAPIAISIATHLPHAVGLAVAARMKQDPIATLAWFGEGATSEGDFHEAMNFAAVFKAPTIFFCTNNQWAISTPVRRQTATESIVEKAEAYGIAGVRIDGFDAVACCSATRDAFSRARKGEGPTLIEAVTYRIGPHATADDPARYRDATEAEGFRRFEPIERLAAFMRRRSFIDEAREAEIHAEAKALVADAVAELKASARPGPEVLFETTYAGSRPPRLEQGDVV